MRILRFFTLVTMLLVSLQVQALDAAVTLDRSLGLLVGDKVNASIGLPVAASELDLKSLPQHEKRYGPWLFLLDSELGEQHLNLHFQLINVPAENREVGTPTLELRTLDGGFISVASVPMQIGSFLEQEAAGEGGGMIPRGDIRIQPQAQDQLLWQLWMALTVLVLSSLIWLVWHLGLRPRQRLPFAHTMFELNRMRLWGRKDDDAANRSLHHAFNRSAGRVVINSELEVLWQQCPWLVPIKIDIENFYQVSAAHFFSTDADEQKDFNQILQLARACRARERLA